MTNNQYELAQHCLDTGEFLTIKTYDRYILFHQNAIKYSDNQQTDFGKIIKSFFLFISLY